jgi:tetratricopeptide (TPR) repeat protein
VTRRQRRTTTSAGQRARAAAILTLALGLVAAAAIRPAHAAPMAGQARPAAKTIADVRKAAADILGAGEPGEARPVLYTAVEADPVADWGDELSRVVGDDATYYGLVDIFEQAARGKNGDMANFLAYNLGRLHLARFRAAGSRTALQQAAAAADRLATNRTLRDASAFAFAGDVYSSQNRLDAAVAAYNRITATGTPGAGALAQLKVAGAYHRQGRYEDARAAYERGVRLDASGGRAGGATLHQLYQGLAALHLERGKDAAAAEALVRSARVTQDPASPFRLRLDVARRLLERRQREVLQYAEAAVRFAPDDADAVALRDRARAQAKR